MTKLHQIVALVKSRKKRCADTLTAAHHMNAKPTLFNGMSRQFKPTQDGAAGKPAEIQNVQQTVVGLIDSVRTPLIDAFDTVLTQDIGNLKALASVVATDGGASLNLKDVPATNLMFLEKQLTDLVTFINGFPVLNPAEVWKPDTSNPGIHRTEPTVTLSTAKVQEPIVLYPHSKEHPANAQLVTKDVTVGEWQSTNISGAISLSDKQRMLRRATVLIEAIKMAREEANRGEVVERKEAASILDFVFGANAP